MDRYRLESQAQTAASTGLQTPMASPTPPVSPLLTPLPQMLGKEEQVSMPPSSEMLFPLSLQQKSFSPLCPFPCVLQGPLTCHAWKKELLLPLGFIGEVKIGGSRSVMGPPAFLSFFSLPFFTLPRFCGARMMFWKVSRCSEHAKCCRPRSQVSE